MPATRGQTLVALAAALVLSLVTGGRAAAHALGAECKLAGDRVHVEAFFDDDTPAPDARVRVADGQKSLVAEGHTNAQGRWSFARPAPGTYEVVVEAAGGHRARVPITVPADPSANGPSEPQRETTPTTISEGPTRQEFTRFPWPKVALGLAAIGG